MKILWKRAVVDIASALETEDPGSNPAEVFREIFVMLLFLMYAIDVLCLVSVFI
jgi:hypothetical protein